jgi:hypothetical protein
MWNKKATGAAPNVRMVSPKDLRNPKLYSDNDLSDFGNLAQE